jgi:hypothetical protein
VSEILKLAQLPQNNGVAEMNIGAGRINSEFDPQWPAKRELLAQVIFANDLRGTFPQLSERLSRLHDLQM